MSCSFHWSVGHVSQLAHNDFTTWELPVGGSSFVSSHSSALSSGWYCFSHQVKNKQTNTAISQVRNTSCQLHPLNRHITRASCTEYACNHLASCDMYKFLSVVAYLLLTLFIEAASADSVFLKIDLPKGVSLSLPKNWVVLTENSRITLQSFVESISGSGDINGDAEIPFAANYYENSETIGIVNLRYYNGITISQDDVRSLSKSDIEQVDIALRQAIVPLMQKTSMQVVEWKGSVRKPINGIQCIVTEYRRRSASDASVFRVRLFRVLAQERSYTLTTSYNEDKEQYMSAITDRIISSLQM